MSEKKVKMTRLTITVPEELLEEFKIYCEKEFRPVSTQIQYMMKQAIDKNKDKS